MKKNGFLLTIAFIAISHFTVGQNTDQVDFDEALQSIRSQLYVAANNDRDKMDLKEKVRSIRTIRYIVEMKNGQVEKGDIMNVMWGGVNEEINFNKKGFITQEKKFTKDGSIREQSNYQYGDNGIYLQTHKLLHSNGKLKAKAVYKEGKILKETSYSNNKDAHHKIIYNYEDSHKANLLNEKSYNASGKLVEEVRYEYDDRGNLVTEKQYKNGNLGYLKVMKYDDRNNKIEYNWKQYNTDGTLRNGSVRSTYKYDENGNKTEVREYKDEKLKIAYSYTYDGKGNLIGMKQYKPGMVVTFTYTYKVNDHGDRVEAKTFNGEGKLSSTTTYEMTYDQMGNWTKKIEYRGSEPKYITERTIKYYESDN